MTRAGKGRQPIGFTPAPKVLVRGFTLVEMMVAFTIVAAGGAALLLFLQQENLFVETSTVSGDVRTRAQLALETVASELRHATRKAAGSPPNIAIPPAPSNTSLTLYLPADANGDGRIIDAQGNVEWNTATPVQYQYNPSQQQLRRTAGAATRVVASNVSGVTFEDQAINNSLNADEVKVQLTLQQTASNQRSLSSTVATIVKLRN